MEFTGYIISVGEKLSSQNNYCTSLNFINRLQTFYQAKVTLFFLP